MDTSILLRQFDRIGARARVSEDARPQARPVSLDIGRDRHGEFFSLRLNPRRLRRLDAVDARPDMRHLLLLADFLPGPPSVDMRPAWLQRSIPRELPPPDEGGKSKFLCGHDERHWFVAAVPEAASAQGVKAAMEALMPAEVREAVARAGVDGKHRLRRRNGAFRRQGEWFFVPAPAFAPDADLILRAEPMARPGGKPHTVDELVRLGGETVYVHDQVAPAGFSVSEHVAWQRANPDRRDVQWRVMRRNPTVFVRGRVRHLDHATLTLQGWHRVFMNTESQAKAMRHVAFLD